MFYIRSSPTELMGLTPHELPRPFTSCLQSGCAPSLDSQRELLTHYAQRFQSAVKFLSHNTQEALTKEPTGETNGALDEGKTKVSRSYSRKGEMSSEGNLREIRKHLRKNI
ncbi:hypothetical protein ILYODFUR_030362 [Ilyodon furcidens]|uniref:Uncharacterized protein n=1 Tax=Ilyodon furcidens TaxID=33524 RepID=A0ABV0UKB4_9TELE